MSDRWPQLSHLNANARQLVIETLEQAELTGVVRDHDVSSGTVIDFSVKRIGTIAAGLELARICMGGLGDVHLLPPMAGNLFPQVQVTTDFPVQACMASQYAGWPLEKDGYFAMCSGPARLLRGREAMLKKYELNHVGGPAVAVLESSNLPGDKVVAEVASQCNVSPADVTLCVASTASLPGCIQVVARSVEVALHKLHEFEFDLTAITCASGVAPLPPVASDDLSAMGRTNDAILYAGHVNLWVETEDSAIESIGQKIPAGSSTEYGAPFLDIFNRFDRDFYKIDPLLFGPARIVMNNIRTGKSFAYGELRPDVIARSFGMVDR